ncbi:MAG: NfeD family protein [Clostridiales bacterium]|jgi:membrane protein implicated in regulation of membrane protease activity|nr:NfeD family protein [Clostridiales bacterium]
MLLLFQVCFIVGLGYAVLSFILGHVLGFFNFDGGAEGDFGAEGMGEGADFDLDAEGFGESVDIGLNAGDISANAEGADAGGSVSPFKPAIIAAFLGAFGGAGMMAFPRLSLYFAFIVAAGAGCLLSFVFYRFVYIPLYRAQNTSAVEIQSLVGKNAKVTEYIPQGKYGQITYHVNGNTYTAPAKSESGEEINRNAEVKIVAIVENTYFVKPAL